MLLSSQEWTQRAKAHRDLFSPIADAFLERRSLGRTHAVHDFLFTYYNLSPSKLKEWVPSFEEALQLDDLKAAPLFSDYWFQVIGNTLKLNPERLQGQALASVGFIEQLCDTINERPPRFGCFGLHEWAMVYRSTIEEVRHQGYQLRLPPDALAKFVESQNLCCTHYDAFRFFTPSAAPLNLFKPTLEERLENEQAGCLHANMDIYKWAVKLWPWIGADFIGRAFLLAVEGRELDMRASPYDLEEQGYSPIRIETEEGRREYQALQQRYAKKATALRSELSQFCKRLRAWKSDAAIL